MTPEEIFEYCWQEIEAGRKTLEECLRLFPDTLELAERLQEANQLRRLRNLTLSPEASRRIENQITARFQHRRRQPKALGLFTSQFQWASLAVAVMIGVLGFVAWVSYSVPGEVPYTIKRSVEEVQVNLTRPDERGEVYADLTEQRLAELEMLVARSSISADVLTAALAEVTESTKLSLTYVLRLPVERRAEVLRQILTSLDRHNTLITAVEASAPSTLAPQIVQAAEAAAENQLLASTYYEATTGAAYAPSATATPESIASATPTSFLAAEATPTQLSVTATLPAATATNALATTPQPSKTASPVPPTNTVQPTQTASPVPPTATLVPPTLTPSATQPGNSDCAAQNPNSPRYCTPTPQP
jgi:hypothetical protein